MLTGYVEKLGFIFYIADRNTTTFEHKQDVPNYFKQMYPMFTLLLLLEIGVHYLKATKIKPRLNDGLTSMSLGILWQTARLLTAGFELAGYEWLYERRFIDLDWTSPWTWWTAALGVDLAYYWYHRMIHEVGIGWSAHQVHHSSEEYNLFTASRQSIFQRFFSFGFHQPLALLGVPLPAILVHMQFNLFFQYWIHTELITTLGPLEWIINTPSHHRVHHGTNKWCLDKNYAGFLIIWDRMFGTFEQERKDEKIVYGLIDQPQTFEPITLQFFYHKAILQKAWKQETWTNTAKALFYGPGWEPGTPRLGDPNALPDKPPKRQKYNPKIPMWIQIYSLVHFVVALAAHQNFAVNVHSFSWLSVAYFVFFIYVSLAFVGGFLDGRWWAPSLESIRCVGFLYLMRAAPLVSNPTLHSIIMIYFFASALLWASQGVALLQGGIKAKNL